MEETLYEYKEATLSKDPVALAAEIRTLRGQGWEWLADRGDVSVFQRLRQE